MPEKPVLLTEHATRRYVSLNVTPEIISEIVRHGRRVRLSKVKWSASRRTKRGTIVVIFAEYAEFIKVITITKGRESS
ncbi:MAG: hypothetical protein WB643_02660 [Candidatus Bathyarchaeia archaeon]